MDVLLYDIKLALTAQSVFREIRQERGVWQHIMYWMYTLQL